ncbi:hypothetical protein HDU84_002083 [Entophlyctis sp. JEL0112]|nr:hypothetical protein HDU84_002083 [Entophlyctis sp. JEL0112]
MSKYETLRTSTPVPNVLLVELNRPAKLNAMNKTLNTTNADVVARRMWRELRELFGAVSADADVRCIVVSGGPHSRGFTTGLDLVDFVADASHVGGSDPARAAFAFFDTVSAMQASLTAMETCRQPVIAAVHGACIGAGIDLITACDVRYAAADSVFSVREVDVGLAADVGTLQRLPKVVGNASWVHEVCFTARAFSASEALSQQLVSKVVDGGHDAVVKAAIATAALIAEKSPVAVTGTKNVLKFSRDHSVEDGLKYVAVWYEFGHDANGGAVRFYVADIVASLYSANSCILTGFARCHCDVAVEGRGEAPISTQITTMSRLVVHAISPPAPMPTQDPFLFAVYHKDAYPAGDAKMQAPKRGNGADFDPQAKYRMYHGDRIPGFPQHPHRGFETITCTLEGLIDHTDSLGCAGRYGNGDVQWMTAGKGIVHGEMFPLVNSDKPNNSRLFQLWINLPKKSKMTKPAHQQKKNAVMQWSENVPLHKSADGKVVAKVWAGSLHGVAALPAPKDSWAARDAGNDVHIYHVAMQPGSKYTLPPPARAGANRTVYFVEGARLRIDGEDVPRHSAVEFRQLAQTSTAAATATTVLENHGHDAVELLVLQGMPIREPVVQHGPFVMSSREEIAQAFSDYQRTQFGGWPWPDDAMVFAKDEGRFLKIKGRKRETPPATGKSEGNSADAKKDEL